MRVEVIAITAAIAVGAAWLHVARPAAVQVAQEIYGNPVGEYDRPIGGPMMYGAPVDSAPIGGPMLYGEPVGSAPIGGPMLYGGPVDSAPIGSPMMYGAPVGEGGDGAPIGGAPLY
jgi:hypothetical protein